MEFKTIIQTARPSFLVLTPVCVFLGLATSLTLQSSINYLIFFLIMMGAMTAHISVNMLNEYSDFKSGLDLKTDKTSFSGGSGALPSHPEMASIVRIIGIIALMVTIAIGGYLIIEIGLQILPIGIAGVVVIITYTQWLNRLPLLCLIAPGLGFGVFMVVGTHVILTGEYSEFSWLVSLVPFFLINNLLLLNQYPDVTADASVGRRTFPIVFGFQRSNIVYGIFVIVTNGLILYLIFKGYLSNLAIVALLPLVLSLFALSGVMKHTDKIGAYPKYMGANVAATIFTPILLGIAIIYG